MLLSLKVMGAKESPVQAFIGSVHGLLTEGEGRLSTVDLPSKLDCFALTPLRVKSFIYAN